MPKYRVKLGPEDGAQLVIHHLTLAMDCFQALPLDGRREALANEIVRRLPGFQIESRVAGNFVRNLCDEYEDIDG